MEAKIWAVAIVVRLVLVVVGLAASFWGRGGVYLVSAAVIVAALALPHRLDRWVAHHTQRFPYGMDLFPDQLPSSTISRGEWEGQARDTVISLTHWTIGLAVAAAAITAAVAVRRRLGPVPPPPEPAPAAATGGAGGGAGRSGAGQGFPPFNSERYCGKARVFLVEKPRCKYCRAQ